MGNPRKFPYSQLLQKYNPCLRALLFMRNLPSNNRKVALPSPNASQANLNILRGFPGVSEGKESSCSAGNNRFHPSVGKVLSRKKGQLTPVFFSGKSHGQGSLVGYSPEGRKETGLSDSYFHFQWFTWPLKWSQWCLTAMILELCTFDSPRELCKHPY